MPSGYTTNIAFRQGGDSMLLGGPAGTPTEHDYDALRQSLSLGNGDFISYWDDFFGDLLADEWAPNLSTGATIAVNSQAGGAIRFTTDTDDTDFATLALGLHWLVSSGPTIFEARIKTVTATTLRAVEVGLSDAVSETNGLAFSSHDVTPVDVADNAAVFGWNAAESTTTWSLLSVNAGTPSQSFAASAALGTTYQTLRIVIAANGEARFYVNGTLLLTRASAVATTALLTPWITLKSQSGATKSIDVDYVHVAGLRV